MLPFPSSRIAYMVLAEKIQRYALKEHSHPCEARYGCKRQEDWQRQFRNLQLLAVKGDRAIIA